jgi:hypothetical protein
MRRRNAPEDLNRALDRLIGRYGDPAVRQALRRRHGRPAINDIAALAYMAEIISLTGCRTWPAALAAGGGDSNAARRLRGKFSRAPARARRTLATSLRRNEIAMAEHGMDPFAAHIGMLEIALSRAADIRQIIRYPARLQAYENNHANLIFDLMRRYFVGKPLIK